MAELPTTFAEESFVIDETTDILAKYAMPFIDLRRQGLVVVAGLTEAKVRDLTEIANQSGTIEFCPKDRLTRWADIPTAQQQLAKDGGRAVFLLNTLQNDETLAFGWTGLGAAEETEITNCPYTFAIRLHEKTRGQRLATPFTRAIVAGSMALFGVRGIGLETWSSNVSAVKSYLRADAKIVSLQNSRRPTLVKEDQDENGERPDTRIYMQLPWSM